VEQLTFELAPIEPPSFANFLVGPNAEAVTALRHLARGEVRETGILLWGAPGSGRTHLLHSVVAAAQSLPSATYYPGPASVAAEPPAAGALVAIDDVEDADPEAQGRLFTLYNRLQASGGHMLVAADAPPGRLGLRDDLRTRLGWGLVYELMPLADADKPAALAHYAEERGFRLGEDVIAYLLAHGRRDMTALLATLAALDRYSLAAKRPITVPLLRKWLQREFALPSTDE
jgi:DnaA family protein